MLDWWISCQWYCLCKIHYVTFNIYPLKRVSCLRNNYAVEIVQQETKIALQTCNWRLTIHQNVVLAILQKPWDIWSLWKIVGTIFQCIIVLQWRREGPKLTFCALRFSEGNLWNIWSVMFDEWCLLMVYNIKKVLGQWCDGK